MWEKCKNSLSKGGNGAKVGMSIANKPSEMLVVLTSLTPTLRTSERTIWLPLECDKKKKVNELQCLLVSMITELLKNRHRAPTMIMLYAER